MFEVSLDVLADAALAGRAEAAGDGGGGCGAGAVVAEEVGDEDVDERVRVEGGRGLALAFDEEGSTELFEKDIANEVDGAELRGEAGNEGLGDRCEQVPGEVEVDEDGAALPDGAVRLVGRDDGDHVAADLALGGGVGGGEPGGLDVCGLEADGDLGAVVGVLAPGACGLLCGVDGEAVALVPGVVRGEGVLGAHEDEGGAGFAGLEPVFAWLRFGFGWLRFGFGFGWLRFAFGSLRLLVVRLHP